LYKQFNDLAEWYRSAIVPLPGEKSLANRNRSSDHCLRIALS